MKRWIRWIVIIVLYLCGTVVFAIPDINHLQNELRNADVYEEFGHNASGAAASVSAGGSVQTEPDAGQEDEPGGKTAGNDEQYARLYEGMRQYNQTIYDNAQKDLTDPWSYEQSGFDMASYGIETNVAATIEIPRMDVELPVYLGATQENMALGAVQLGQTSLPVGGENTNCVIAAHRGYKGIPMFRDIELLESGDEVLIRNFWGELTYQVSEIEIIDPSDIERILIRPEEDMVTLLTCHPYTQNSQRYVVFCTRCGDGEGSTGNTEEMDDAARRNAEMTAEQAAESDGEILERERLLRMAGYGFLAVVGIAIIGRVIYEVIHERKGNGCGRRRASCRDRRK